MQNHEKHKNKQTKVAMPLDIGLPNGDDSKKNTKSDGTCQFRFKKK